MTVKIKLKYERDTKNTNVFKNDEDGAAIPSLYIAKSACGDKTFSKGDEITVEIKEIK